MSPNLLDHLFVLSVMGIVFPFVGWWAYRRFLLRYARDGEPALVREYKITILWLIGLGAATLLVWLAGGRAVDALGLRGFVLTEENETVAAIMLGGSISLAVRPILAALSPKARASFARQFATLSAFLPRTREQLGWGLGVSLAAGVFEEIAYRGYLLAYLQTWLEPAWAIAAGAALFGLAHAYQGKAGTLMTAVLGGLFGYMYLTTGSLLLPIVLHVLVDVSAMITAYIVLRPRRG